MQNLKTGIVVALLLAVCYGAFKALNAPEPDLPPELAEWVAEEPDFDSLVDDIQVPDQNTKSKTDTEIGGLPSISLPQAELPALIKPESNLHSHTLGGQSPSGQALGGQALGGQALGRQALGGQALGGQALGGQALGGQALGGQAPKAPAIADGPAIKVPAPLGIAQSAESSESLVPDSLSPAPLDKPATPLPSPSNTIPNPSDSISSFPSIPLPSGSLVSAKNSDLGALPLLDTPLPESAASSGQSTSSEQKTLEPFATAREKALKQANEGKLKEALVLLSQYYRNPEMSHKEYEDLLEILDALASEVIYSPRHLLQPAFTVGASHTLVSIAAQHNVTPELLKSINQLGDSQALTHGQKLKVIEGPFRGEVDLTLGEMTLFLKDMYACRFPIAVGTDFNSKVGSFEVSDKRTDRTYYGVGGKVINAADPSNPYGGYWIDLGGNCIHGSPEMAATDLKSAGCISLAPIDAADAFIMLTLGSQVEFRK